MKYTNGVGHLIMSIVFTAAGLLLILLTGNNAYMQAVGVGLILTVQAAWFVSGGAKQVAAEVLKQLPPPQPPSNTAADGGTLPKSV